MGGYNAYMVKRIIIILFWFMVLALIVLWLWAGGTGKIYRAVRAIPNPVDILWGNSTGTYGVAMPWQIAVPQGPDLSGYAEEFDAANTDPQVSQDAPQSQVRSQVQDPHLIGVPSPHAGEVTLGAGNAQESGGNEYVEIRAHSQTPVSLNGWSLQSALSGIRAYIPQASPLPIVGTMNRLTPVVLDVTGNAVVSSGPSPLGISFRENRCTGYLAQQQSFEPSLANACPSPSEVTPRTVENLQRYGADCMDYLGGMPQCSFPASLPLSLSPMCRIYITNTFSYNGCVSAYQDAVSFAGDTWRIYLGANGDLWSNSHDVIRLLDEQGRTVDAITY